MAKQSKVSIEYFDVKRCPNKNEYEVRFLVKKLFKPQSLELKMLQANHKKLIKEIRETIESCFK